MHKFILQGGKNVKHTKEQYDAWIQRGGGGQGIWTSLPPLENHKAIGFHINTGPGPLENKKATKQASETPCKMTFHWRADDGQLLVVFESPLP